MCVCIIILYILISKYYSHNLLLYTTLMRLSIIITLYIGKSEDIRDMLRSILAQLHFTHQIRHWDSLGVPFKSHMHVPEIHPVTGQLFCEREDEGHVLKVRCMSLSIHCQHFGIQLLLPYNTILNDIVFFLFNCACFFRE